ncbi:hypothetical protein EBU02_13625 [bacterium]|nr:hypothetical protein [bacterium]NBS53701.1 hypothetical protein [Spartobacteria bacterium]
MFFAKDFLAPDFDRAFAEFFFSAFLWWKSKDENKIKNNEKRLPTPFKTIQLMIESSLFL